jgi:cytochrome c553
MKYLASVLGMAAWLACIGTAQSAGDVQAGKVKAAGCAGCHGAEGQGVPPNPKIAGMTEDRFVAVMADYKSGKRNHAVMKALATPLSDQDVANLAAYYASLK